MGGQLIGIDVGGTKLSVAVLEGENLDVRQTIPTAAADSEALIEEIVAAVQTTRAAETVGVGVGVPSVVEFATGRVKWSVNVKLADVPLRDLLQERLGLPVFVDNDSTCAALAEAHEGTRIAVRNLVMLTVGTGIGGGLVLDGRVYRGTTGAAGELGHTMIGADLERGAPETHGFPQPGSLEALASGHALDLLALTRGQGGRGPDVVAAAKAGDREALSLVRLIGERLGVGIANAINTFDPEVVVIGGGVAEAGELLLGPARETAQRFIVPGIGEETEIRVARYGAHAGVRGAALLAAQQINRMPEEGLEPPTRGL